MLEWLARLPADELDRRPRLLLAAAWSLALSERHEEASRLVERILAQPGADAALRCECALILERRGGLSPTTPTASPRCTTPGPTTRR